MRHRTAVGRAAPTAIALTTLALISTLTALLFLTASLRADPAVGQPTSRPATKLACVGDSITYGAGIKDRAHDSYPAQLAHMLGDEYKVRNFGVSGATLLKKGDRPYDK